MLGCLVLGALIISLIIRTGVFSLTLVSGFLVGAAGQLFAILALMWLARRRGVSISKLIYGERTWQREMLIGVAVAITLWAIAFGLWLVGLIPISDRLSLVVLESPLLARLGFFAIAVLLAPIGEELLYRGALQGGVTARFNIYVACLVQAFLFALMHQKSLVVMLTIFVGGLTYGLVVHKRKSLFASISTHAAFNAVGAGWLVLLLWLNAHDPAVNLSEAKSPPGWLSESSGSLIPERGTAAEQFELVIQRFGSQGLQLWKHEIQGLAQVRQRFPDDNHYGALSLAAIQEIYLLYLDDPWRAITAGQELLDGCPQQRELCARATIINVRACLSLQENRRAEEWLKQAENEYADVERIRDQATILKQELMK